MQRLKISNICCVSRLWKGQVQCIFSVIRCVSQIMCLNCAMFCTSTYIIAFIRQQITLWLVEILDVVGNKVIYIFFRILRMQDFAEEL